jgi:ankyrin repeat protein
LASDRGQTEAVKLLLEAGADREAKDEVRENLSKKKRREAYAYK